MYDSIQSKQVKTRKTHWCCWCGDQIIKGRLAQYRAYKFEGDFNNDWMHPECFDAMESIDGGIFEFNTGDYHRGSTKHIED